MSNIQTIRKDRGTRVSHLPDAYAHKQTWKGLITSSIDIYIGKKMEKQLVCLLFLTLPDKTFSWPTRDRGAPGCQVINYKDFPTALLLHLTFQGFFSRTVIQSKIPECLQNKFMHLLKRNTGWYTRDFINSKNMFVFSRIPGGPC